MSFLVVFLGIFFSCVATAVIAHISMAAGVGPWIAPTIVLISGTIVRIMSRKVSQQAKHQDIALIQTIGSVGGAIAMGVGFTLPMLYFLDTIQFTAWTNNRLYFCAVLATACLSAGGFGIWLARTFARTLIAQDTLTFPVSGLIHQTITSQSQKKQARSMFKGFFGVVLFAFLRDGLWSFKGLFPTTIAIFPHIFGRALSYGLAPFIWSMGFLVGITIAFPLFIGLVARYLILIPLNNHSMYVPYSFFSPFPHNEFMMQFCSGIVVSGVIVGLIKYLGTFPTTIQRLLFTHSNTRNMCWRVYYRNLFHNGYKTLVNLFRFDKNQNGMVGIITAIEPLLVLTGCFAFLHFFSFSLLSQVVMLGLTVIFAYQISVFSARVGLVPFGRFTTFIMLPTMVLFGLNYVQLTILSVFTNICFGVATDLLFDYKVGQLTGISFGRIYRYQWLGLVTTALCLGPILLLFFSHFELGSAGLLAYRAWARALLIQSISFNWEPVLLGFLFGLLLKPVGLNPMMVFGGILMPSHLTLGLITGALLSWLDVNAKEHSSFWSGVFAGESTWILVRILLMIT